MSGDTRARPRRTIAASAVAGALLALAIPVTPAYATTIPPSTRHAPYSYLATQPRNAKAPVRWDPCTVHRYKIVSGGTDATVRASLGRRWRGCRRRPGSRSSTPGSRP